MQKSWTNQARTLDCLTASFHLNPILTNSMKTPRWFGRPNSFLSYLRTATAVTLTSAAAAMAFVAGGNTLVTVSSPPSQLSQDRLVISKIAGDPDAGPTRARTTPGEGPIGAYEAYKSAARTY